MRLKVNLQVFGSGELIQQDELLFSVSTGRTEEMLDSENQDRVEGLSNKISRLKGVRVNVLSYVWIISVYAKTVGQIP